MTYARKAAVSMGTILALAGLVGGVATGVASSIIWVNSAISDSISPVQAQTTVNTNAIATINSNLEGVNTKLDFLLGKYGAQYIPQSGKIITK